MRAGVFILILFLSLSAFGQEAEDHESQTPGQLGKRLEEAKTPGARQHSLEAAYQRFHLNPPVVMQDDEVERIGRAIVAILNDRNEAEENRFRALELFEFVFKEGSPTDFLAEQLVKGGTAPDVSEKFAIQLGKIFRGSQEARRHLDILIQRTKDKDSNTRRLALIAISGVGNKAAETASGVIPLTLKDPNIHVQLATFDLIASLGEKGHVYEKPLLEQVVTKPRNESELKINPAIIRTLGKIGSVAPATLELLIHSVKKGGGDPLADEAASAFLELATSGKLTSVDEKTWEALKAASHNPDLVKEIYPVLAALGNTILKNKVIELLINNLKNKRLDSVVRAYSAKYLGPLLKDLPGNSELFLAAEKVVRSALRENDEFVMGPLVRGIGDSGHTEFLADLQKLPASQDPRIQLEMNHAMGRLGKSASESHTTAVVEALTNRSLEKTALRMIPELSLESFSASSANQLLKKIREEDLRELKSLGEEVVVSLEKKLETKSKEELLSLYEKATEPKFKLLLSSLILGKILPPEEQTELFTLLRRYQNTLNEPFLETILRAAPGGTVPQMPAIASALLQLDPKLEKSIPILRRILIGNLNESLTKKIREAFYKEKEKVLTLVPSLQDLQEEESVQWVNILSELASSPEDYNKLAPLYLADRKDKLHFWERKPELRSVIANQVIKRFAELSAKKEADTTIDDTLEMTDLLHFMGRLGNDAKPALPVILSKLGAKSDDGYRLLFLLSAMDRSVDSQIEKPLLAILNDEKQAQLHSAVWYVLSEHPSVAHSLKTKLAENLKDVAPDSVQLKVIGANGEHFKDLIPDLKKLAEKPVQRYRGFQSELVDDQPKDVFVTLTKMGKEGRKALEDIFEASEPPHRMEVLMAWESMGAEGKQYVPKILKELQKRTHPSERMNIFQALAAIDKSDPKVVDVFANNEPPYISGLTRSSDYALKVLTDRMIARATNKLGEIDVKNWFPDDVFRGAGEAGKENARRLLRSNSVLLKTMGAQYLEDLGVRDEEVLKARISFVNNQAAQDYVSVDSSMERLMNFGPKGAAAVADMLKNGSEDRKYFYAQYLQRKPHLARAHLPDITKELENPTLRYEVAMALLRTLRVPGQRTRSTLPVLQKLTVHPNPFIAREAKEAISAIQYEPAQ